MVLPGPLRDAALRWIADDPDPGTRAELQRVLATAMAGGDGATAAGDELADRRRVGAAEGFGAERDIAVEDRGDLEVAELAAIDARYLTAGEGRAGCGGQDGRERSGRGRCEEMAAIDHGNVPEA